MARSNARPFFTHALLRRGPTPLPPSHAPAPGRAPAAPCTRHPSIAAPVHRCVCVSPSPPSALASSRVAPPARCDSAHASLLSLSAPLMVDTRCTNRVMTGASVGGALGASIGECGDEESGRERGRGHAPVTLSLSLSHPPPPPPPPRCPSSPLHTPQAPSTARTRPSGTRCPASTRCATSGRRRCRARPCLGSSWGRAACFSAGGRGEMRGDGEGGGCSAGGLLFRRVLVVVCVCVSVCLCLCVCPSLSCVRGAPLHVREGEGGRAAGGPDRPRGAAQRREWSEGGPGGGVCPPPPPPLLPLPVSLSASLGSATVSSPSPASHTPRWARRPVGTLAGCPLSLPPFQVGSARVEGRLGRGRAALAALRRRGIARAPARCCSLCPVRAALCTPHAACPRGRTHSIADTLADHAA